MKDNERSAEVDMKVPNIRFNLKFYASDGSDIVIRTLADLEANLNLSDLWDYFKAGDLARWLRSIDETVKADSLVELNQKSDGVRIAPDEVCRVLQLTVPKQEVAAFVEMEERRRSRVEQSKLKDGWKDGCYEEGPYIEFVRGLIKNKLDILQTHKIMIKMLNHYPDLFVRDCNSRVFQGLPFVWSLCHVLDDAWKCLCRTSGGSVFCCRDRFGHRFDYECPGGPYNSPYIVNDQGTGNLNSAFEVVYDSHTYGRYDFGLVSVCCNGYRYVVLKQKVIERLQEQDVMHDFVFTHD